MVPSVNRDAENFLAPVLFAGGVVVREAPPTHFGSLPARVLDLFLEYVGAREYEATRDLVYAAQGLKSTICIKRGGREMFYRVIYKHPSLVSEDQARIVIMGEVHDAKNVIEHNACFLDAMVVPGSLFLAESYFPGPLGALSKEDVVQSYQISAQAQAQLIFSGWDCCRAPDTESRQKTDAACARLEREALQRRDLQWGRRELSAEIDRLGREGEAKRALDQRKSERERIEDRAKEFQVRNRALAHNAATQSRLYGGRTFAIAGLFHLRPVPFTGSDRELIKNDPRFGHESIHHFFEATPGCLVIYPEVLLTYSKRRREAEEGKRPEGEMQEAAAAATYTPSLASRVKGCFQCGKLPQPTEKLKICSGCGGVTYCSRDCQAAHWKAGHKRVCKPKGKK